ncbi:hypothetical protein [Candidatus Chromulinivorax destructor]|uniref:Uncharacterized protein n=1 Tax=Candidatus Chromulinivorax destructor TaxID=2066483 RepID=A0A345ZBY9_9BACT|nr:hypothetical protein [Candidatus Chromulinivorax destructor]AXK60806.1 hypothetical protein C0J27_03600 [Candidatus Chromulinivorax destructor]
MKILRDLLALVGLATLVIAGYCYYSACKNPIEVVVIQKKIGGKVEKAGDETAKVTNEAINAQKDPNVVDDELEGTEMGLTVSAELMEF